ncbi:MAG: PD40 domain-containing protein, partial [Acidimicrobiia bacterium]|nr:PD40 domain-containing protein [Acidimicrobiia bacterium]
TAPVYDGGVPITGYTVTASPGGASVTVFATQATATVPGLTNGTRYTFTVQAVNSAGPGTVSDPSNSVTPVSMFNGRIAFTRQVGSVGQIFTANADGSDARQITSDPGGSATPSWSPDGTQLAIDGGPAPQGVYVINADGSSPRRVSDNPALFISWSPDGTKLAYIRPGTAANTIDIATVNIDGTGETHLGTGVAPAWTPDSQGIVFLNNHQLWRMNADGSERTPLLPSESGSAPSVSPDGSKVVFDGADGIRVVGIDGSNSTLLYPSTTADWPRWSRDGSRIVFQTARASTTGSSLAVMNADGSNIHTITTTQGNDQFPDWQPLSQDPNGTFVPLSPARILDTRTTNSPIGQNRSIDIQATGQGGVPAAGVTAVVVNLTATQPTAASYLTAYPAGIARPAASNLNFVAGETIANLVTVKVGTGGKFSVYNLAGLTHVVADVVGWYSDGSVVPGDRYTPLSPARILDTRTTNAPLTQGQTRSVQVAGQGGVPASGVSAVVVNVTETGATANGFFTVYPSDAPSRPNASNLNFVAGETIPNLAVVKLGADGKVDLYNLAGSAHAIFDVVGYYGSGGSAYSALTPSRILDTRTNNTPLGQGETRPVQVAGQGGVPVTGATAVVVNVTETGATANGFFTVYPSDAPSRPNASNLNFVAGETIPNLVVVKLGADGKVDLYNLAGSAHAIFDVVGYFGP